METDKEMQLNVSYDIEAMEAGQRAEYDIQIATAKKYPRNLSKVKENCIAIVTMDRPTAESCRYALPRAGKSLIGPSVHLARIIAQQYGNIRVDARIKQITNTQIISEAVAFDLETNYAVKVEIRRSILNRLGQRFNEDMVVVTGNAANAISFRNAVLAVVPRGLTNSCFDASVKFLTGDLSTEQKLIKERNRILELMKKNYKITEEQILTAIGLRSINQVKPEQIADLIALGQSIKDGDSTVEEIFIKPEGESVEEELNKKKEAIKTKKPGTR